MKISEEKKEKIFEQIIYLLYQLNPKPLFTSQIAKEIARDEEFIKKLLLILREKRIISEIKKNPRGTKYLRRSRWILSDQVYNTYKNSQ